MRTLHFVLLSISFALLTNALFAEEEAPIALEEGNYEFRLQFGEEKVEVPALLKAKADAFELYTFDERGVPVSIKGSMKAGKIAAGYTIGLKDKARTCHVYGGIDSKTEAHGSISFFENGEKTKAGNWELIKVEKDNLTIEPGEYSLNMIAPMMPPGKDDTGLPAKVKIEADAIVIDTRGMAGNAIKIAGRLVHGKVYAGVTTLERERGVITLQFVGKVTANNRAEGEFFAIGNDRKAFEGRWILSKKGGMFEKYRKSRKGKRRIAFYQIHQPDVNHPNDDVIIWKTPKRESRAFMLSPGTKIDVIETVDGSKYGSPHIMYKIKTADGRTGWVPKKWCKQIYK